VVERGLCSSLPPTELARRDLTLFGEVKCLFSTTPEVGKETEANGGHCGDRTLHQTRSRIDQTRPVSSQQLLEGRVLGFLTGRWSSLTSASGQFTCAQKKSTRPARPVPHETGASGQVSRGAERSGVLIGRAARPIMCDRTRLVTLGAYWTPTGRQVQRVRSNARARPVTATVTSDAHYSRLSCTGHPDRCIRSARFEPCCPVTASCVPLRYK
jgi:hypothetical protein